MVELMQGVNGLHGGGPWRILADCPAIAHNSVRAAKGIRNDKENRAKCICPHAVDALMAWRAVRAVHEASRMRIVHRRKDSRTRLQPPAPEAVSRRSPNFVEGTCTTTSGRMFAELGLNDQASHKGIAEREAAKQQCRACPMLQQCRRWVLAEESPAGSWGGVWGGLDPWNRKGLELVIRNGRAEVVPYVAA